MCGIAGVFSALPGSTKRLVHHVTEMVELLRHRGPDDRGIWIDPEGSVILGHCRLAIIDLTPQGHQPMMSRCGRYIISFNGEIYNFQELKQELQRSGVVFRGNSDTEVLLEAVADWGIHVTLEKIIGMFAFAVWDKSEKRLYLTRDRLGQKPLYYLTTPSVLYFASEIKAIHAIFPQLQIHEVSLGHYLSCGFIPSPHTIYENLKEVSPGELFVWDSNLNQHEHRYWNITWEPKYHISTDIAVQQVEELLKEAIRIRLRSDVPLGCFLSGGIDSGLSVALASQYVNNELITLNVKVDDEHYDESQLAKLVANKYGTKHYTIQITPDIQHDLPKIVAAYDEPFADPSSIPSYLISREARKYVKVVLNGDGGDEVFGGYRRHKAMFLLSRYTRLFSSIPSSWILWFNSALPVPKRFRSTYAFIYRFLRGIKDDPIHRYMNWALDGFTKKEKLSLWCDDPSPRILSTIEFLAKKFHKLEQVDPIDFFVAMDLVFQLPDCLLVKMDIATMAYGLEARSPFLDHRLVEYTSRLSNQIKLKSINTKPILRRIARNYLPKSVVKAPKRGFEIPLIKWLRGDLSEMLNDVCLSSNGIILQLFKKDYIESLLSERLEIEPGRWANRVWILFMLGMWDQVNENSSYSQ